MSTPQSNDKGHEPTPDPIREGRQKLAFDIFEAFYRVSATNRGEAEPTQSQVENAWAADGKTRGEYNCVAGLLFQKIIKHERSIHVSGIFNTQVGNDRFQELLRAETHFAQATAALTELRERAARLELDHNTGLDANTAAHVIDVAHDRFKQLEAALAQATRDAQQASRERDETAEHLDITHKNWNKEAAALRAELEQTKRERDEAIQKLGNDAQSPRNGVDALRKPDCRAGVGQAARKGESPPLNDMTGTDLFQPINPTK